MDSQKLLGNVVESLRVRTKPEGGDVGSQSAGVNAGLASSSSAPPLLDDDEVKSRAERGGFVDDFLCLLVVVVERGFRG